MAHGPRSEQATPSLWKNFDFATISHFEPRPTAPALLNRSPGKAVGKVLMVDLDYRFANLLKYLETVTG